MPAEPTEEPRVDRNASIPTLANELLAETQAAAIRNKPLEPTSESDNFLQLAKDATKPLNPHRPDKELGDLDWRFSEDTGRFAMDEEVGRLNSRLVIEDPENGAEHVLHGGSSELYLADRLRDLDHSFENATKLPDICTHPLRMTHYPQVRDNFTDDLSLARSNGDVYQEYLSKVKVSVPLLIKFVLEHGESNVAQDGELGHNDLNVADRVDGGSTRDPKGTDPVQGHQVMFGCCCQASSDEYVNGHCAPNVSCHQPECYKSEHPWLQGIPLINVGASLVTIHLQGDGSKSLSAANWSCVLLAHSLDMISLLLATVVG